MILIVCIILLVQQSAQQSYEGDSCVEADTSSPGRCCLVNACRSAQDDLRQRKRQPTLCSFEGSTPVVCCREGCGAAGGGGGSAATERQSEIMCAEYEKISKRNARNIETPAGNPLTRTGRAGASQVARARADEEGGTFHAVAVGGVDTKPFEFPHMAALAWPKKGGGFAFNCGGSLISDRFVVTAGHCLSNGRDSSLASPTPTLVRLGDQNILESVIDGAQPLDVPIETVIRHRDFQSPSKYFDIALLKLKTAVPFSEHIKPACLWTQPTFGSYKTAIVTGWGTTVSGGVRNSAVLQKVVVDILETEVCQPLLRKSWNRNWQGFRDHQLCAGVLAGGKDACQGDSGGPLQIQSPSKQYYVIGVTSFGRECGKPNLPGVYTRVSAFVDWIESVVWPTAG